MLLMRCIFLTSITIVTLAGGAQMVNRNRTRRLVQFDSVKTISIEEHDRDYPFVVGIKSVQKSKKLQTRCTGTVIAPHFVLTTGQCVWNPSKITVFKHDNPHDRVHNTKGVDVEIRDNITELNEKVDEINRPYPNPIYHGLIIDRKYQWSNINPMDENNRFPLKNVALVYLNKPLFGEAEITYPVIGMNPSFLDKPVDGDLFGWCENETDKLSKADPRLTMTQVRVEQCVDSSKDSDLIKDIFVCLVGTNKDAKFCEMDQGGPLVTWPDKDVNSKERNKVENNPNQRVRPTPSLIAIINTRGLAGPNTMMLYVWPFTDWIRSVMEEYSATPEPPSECPSTMGQFNETIDTKLPILSYYDYNGLGTKQVRSMKMPCVDDMSAAVSVRRRVVLIIVAAVIAIADAFYLHPRLFTASTVFSCT